MPDQSELQQKYLEFQMLDQQLKQTQKQMQLLEEQLVEIIYTQQSLEELKNVQKDTEILVPVSSGIFTKARLEEPGELVVNVGASTAVTKSINSTKEMLGRQIDEVQKLREQLVGILQKIEAQMEILEKQLSEATQNGE